MARNTPPPKALQRGRDLRYRRAESEPSTRTGTRTPASISTSRPSMPSSLATRMSILKLPGLPQQQGGGRGEGGQVRLTGVLVARAASLKLCKPDDVDNNLPPRALSAALLPLKRSAAMKGPGIKGEDSPFPVNSG